MSSKAVVSSKPGSGDGSGDKSISKSRDPHSSEKNLGRRRLSKDVPSRIQLIPGPRLVLPTVMVDDEDVTPQRLDPFVYEAGRERPITIQDNFTRESFIMIPQSIVRVDSQRFHATLLQQKQEIVSQAVPKKSMIGSNFEEIMPAVEMTMASRISDVTATMHTDDVESETEVTFKVPQQISLVLTETETIFLLDLPSCTTPRGTEEAEAAEEDNKLYEYMVKGKGRNRKMLTVAVQTLPILSKVRDTETDKVQYKNNSTYVSTWEMYDTLHQGQRGQCVDCADSDSSEEDDFEDEGFDLMNLHGLKEEASLDSYRQASEDKELMKIVKSKVFFDALIVIERILGNNTFNEEQKRFKGLSEPDPFVQDKVYKYHLDLLWRYCNDATEGKCVSGLAFNAHNEDIVAVAYGKYYYSDRNCDGMVMIWNFKNPQQPERHYNFGHPVTSIAFANKNPNLLAVGFYNGHVKVLDVSKRDCTIIRENSVTSFEPVWSVLWFEQGVEEDLMASFGDGKVCRFQIKGGFKLKCTQIMIAAQAEGMLKGIKYLKKCEDKDISVNRYEEARCLALHPVDAFTYFVGTSEGVVHRCSTNYYNEHMDVFKAHDGAIHTMKFAPFADKLFFTCGDDFRSRLWVDGIYEPLVAAEPALLPVLDVDWSPTHATILATTRGSDVLIWDMQRKMYAPQSQTKCCDRNVFNTVCRFTPNGRCLMVGDMAGIVRVYCLEDMPIVPFFPEQQVYKSLKMLLVTKPELLMKVRKLGSLKFDKRQQKYFH